VAVATLLGALIFVTKTVFPSPIDKMFIVIHALLLALGALLLRRMGGTYVASIGGVLTALWRTAFAPFSFAFAVLYGLLVDGFFFIFKVNTEKGEVKTGRLVASMTVSTGLTGFLSFYVTTLGFGLVPRNPVLETTILVVGTLSGSAAGYLASIIWTKRFRHAKV